MQLGASACGGSTNEDGWGAEGRMMDQLDLCWSTMSIGPWWKHTPLLLWTDGGDGFERY